MKHTPKLFPLCLMLLAWGPNAGQASPVIAWEFGEEDVTGAVKVGDVHSDVGGPRPPEYPNFEAGNTAIQFNGNGARLELPDPGPASDFDFTNGDAITLEAWVELDGAQGDGDRQVIGKGRAGARDSEASNQNWALILRTMGDSARIGFQFATPLNAADASAHRHRWTSREGLAADSGWHHLAVTYLFGKPKSIRAWIDGKPVGGEWDLGGPTLAAPVVDDEAIWIGSAMGADPANSFRGRLDSVAIHREVVEEDELAARYRRPEPESSLPAAMPDLGPLPRGQVLATFHERMPAHDHWLKKDETVPPESMRWSGSEFLLPRLPQRYEDWGIRESWAAPVLARLAADVALPAGKHRVVLRARGLSRLWIDGELIATTEAHGRDSGGHDPVVPIPEPPMPGLRPVGYGVQEVIGEISVESNRIGRVVLENLVGGKDLRAEPGELTVALETADGRTFHLMRADGAECGPIALTDEAVEDRLAAIEAEMRAFDDANRKALASTQDRYWQMRHQAARDWADRHPAAAPPTNRGHPIDAFISGKIDRAVAEAAKTPNAIASQFHREVMPILREDCFRCHGEKDKSGLRLNTLEAALAGGISGFPAVVPGKASESELILRIIDDYVEDRMPPKGDPLPPEKISILEDWINAGAAWPAPPLDPEAIALRPVVDDATFMRRAYFDTVGVPPTEREARAFLDDEGADKRTRLIDRLLADERWADHWISYWQDVLAENPSMLKPSLNNTGPFRWYLHEALRDGKSLDRMVTELVMLRGSVREGGTAGFGLAVSNDAPFAAKGHIVATAFLGIELQCARCHDSPYHSTTQRDLYSLAAFIERKEVTVPASSRVPDAFFEKKGRESLIQVTLKPKEPIAPIWPFAEQTGVADSASLDRLMRNPDDPRERLATLLTAPENTRFAQVIVNRVWKRLMGAAFVEPVDDWEGRTASDPELLDWLATEFVRQGYDLRELSRLIMTSAAYQRPAVGRNLEAAPEQRFFAAPEPRRLSAEQVVDALFVASGQEMDVEELNLDAGGFRAANAFVSLGAPKRSWMMASLSNERDRPSLSLPRAQVLADVLESFGWTGSRQNPRAERDREPNVLQPGVLENGALSLWITTAAAGSDLAELAIRSETPSQLVESLYLRFYSRPPSSEELSQLTSALKPGFSRRILPEKEVKPVEPHQPLPRVSWANHLSPEANSIKMEQDLRARSAPPADPRLRPEWREVFEDVVWCLVNTREFVWLN